MRLLFLLLPLGIAYGQSTVTWAPIGPSQINGKTATLENGKTQALAVFAGNPQIMYAAGGVGSGSEGPPSQAGAFKTTNGGAHWTAINKGLTDASVNALWVDASNSDLVLAGTEAGGIFRSTDGGATWASIGSYAPVSDFLPVGNTILAAAGGGIIASGDGGATWNPVVTSNAAVRTLASAGGNILAGTDSGAILWESGTGASFQRVYQASGAPPNWVWSVAVNPAAPSNAYAVIGHGNTPATLMVTNDSGQTWTPLTVGAGPQAVAFAPSINTIFMAGTDGLWTSKDGKNWSMLPFGRWDSRRIYWNDAKGILYLGTDQGLHQSTDNGTTFTSLTAALTNSIATGLAVHGSTILMGTHDFDPMLSFNGGSSWTQPSYKSGGTPGGEDGPVLISGNSCYADTAVGYQYSSDGCQTFHFTNNAQFRGLTWVRPGSVNAIAVAPSDPTRVFVATMGGVGRSTDSGVTMTMTTWPLPQATAIAVHPKDPNTMLVGTTSGLFRTGDGGSTWTPVATGVNGIVTTIAFNPADPTVVLAGMSTGVTVVRSTDSGVTFKASNTGLPATLPSNLPATACCGWDMLSIRFSTDGLAALGTRGGAYLSTDGGQTWQNITANSVSTYFSDLAWDGGYLYAATYGGGVMRTTAPTAAPPPVQPTVAVSSVVNGASFQPAISAGSWVSIGGTNLSQTARPWAAADFVNGQLPTSLDGVSASINGQPAAIAYISPTLLNVLAPANSGSGSVPVKVSNSLGTSVAFNATVAAVSPAFFLIAPQTPAATHADNSLIGPADLFPGATTPAQPGETIVLFGTGFGAAPDASTVTVSIGGQAAQVVYAGNTTGLCQINVVVPQVGDGNAALTATVGGVSTPQVSLALK